MPNDERDPITGAADANQGLRRFAAKSTSRPIWDTPLLDENGFPDTALYSRAPNFASKRTSGRCPQYARKNTSGIPRRQYACKGTSNRPRLQLAAKHTAPRNMRWPTYGPVRQTARKSTSPPIFYMRPVDMDNTRHENLQLPEDEEFDDFDLEEDDVVILDPDYNDDDGDDKGSSDEDEKPPSNGHSSGTSAPIGV